MARVFKAFDVECGLLLDMAMEVSARASDDSFVGTVIADRYRVLRLLGRGGMGAVYEAEHISLGRRVAIKKLASHLIGHTDALARFRREAEVVAGFQHPNIVAVLDWVTLDDGSPCIVMEHLKGEELATRIRARGQLDWPELGRICDEVLSALSVAHRAGIIHRDLKPQNIFLAVDDEGRESAKLLDFGVSKIHDSSMVVTTDARVIGTPAYMSPEQADGKQDEVSAAADIWAMGAVMFEMAAGVQAFSAATVPSVLYRICHGEPDVLGDYRDDVPPAFAQVIDHCLTRDIGARAASAEAVREELRDALAALAPGAFRELGRRVVVPNAGGASTPVTGATTTLSASAVAVTQPAQVPPRRRRIAMAAGLATVLLAAAAIALTIGMGREDRSASGDGAPASASSGRAAPTTPSAPAEVARRPAAVEASADGPSAPELPTEPETLVVDSDPQGANVFDENNRYLGITPMTYPLGPGQERIRVTLRKPGYEERVVELSAGAAAQALQLSKKARPPREELVPERAVVDDPPVADDPPVEKKLRGAYETDL